jgi:hypothetical protein
MLCYYVVVVLLNVTRKGTSIMTTVITNPVRTSRLDALRRRMGSWAFVRYLKNQGVPFETALFIVTGKREVR